MEKKYELTNERRVIRAWYGRKVTLHRIVAVRDFDVNMLQTVTCFVGDEGHIEKRIITKHIEQGDLGGWIESEKNLSHEGNAWVDKGAVVFDEAVIKDNAWVGGEKTTVAGRVIVCDEAKIYSDDRDKNKLHRTDVAGVIEVTGYSKITSSMRGKGIVKNQYISRPAEVLTKEPPQAKVKFECSIGDRKIAREYVL